MVRASTRTLCLQPAGHVESGRPPKASKQASERRRRLECGRVRRQGPEARARSERAQAKARAMRPADPVFGHRTPDRPGGPPRARGAPNEEEVMDERELAHQAVLVEQAPRLRTMRARIRQSPAGAHRASAKGGSRTTAASTAAWCSATARHRTLRTSSTGGVGAVRTPGSAAGGCSGGCSAGCARSSAVQTLRTAHGSTPIDAASKLSARNDCDSSRTPRGSHALRRECARARRAGGRVGMRERRSDAAALDTSAPPALRRRWCARLTARGEPSARAAGAPAASRPRRDSTASTTTTTEPPPAGARRRRG
jgi:hypothetical protein